MVGKKATTAPKRAKVTTAVMPPVVDGDSFYKETRERVASLGPRALAELACKTMYEVTEASLRLDALVKVAREQLPNSTDVDGAAAVLDAMEALGTVDDHRLYRLGGIVEALAARVEAMEVTHV